MKKGQLSARPVMSFLIILIVGMIFIFGYKAISDLAETDEQLSYAYVANTLAKAIKISSGRPFGTIEEKTIALPRKADHVCFVDKDKPISPFTSCLLNFEVEKFEEKNVFLSPFNSFNALEINQFEIHEQDNPLCLKAKRGRIHLSLTNTGEKSMLGTFSQNDKLADCVAVRYNKDPKQALDIVFLGYGYGQYDNFASDVNDNIQLFLDTEPFKSNSNNINFYRIDNFLTDACEINKWIKCDEYRVKQLASFCPHDYVMVLTSRSKIKDIISPVRSSAVSNIAKINTADSDLVLLHEFGHIFGKLGDEYVDEKYYAGSGLNIANFPNCDAASCSKWNKQGQYGCFEGCSLSGYFRPTKNSLMRSLLEPSFGPYNERVLQKNLEAYDE